MDNEVMDIDISWFESSLVENKRMKLWKEK